MFDIFDPSEVVKAVGGTFAGRDYSAPSADQPQMCMPGDAGPFGFMGPWGQTLGDLGRGMSQEGLMGMFGPDGHLDVEGMLDRQEAQRELASQFQVVKPEDLGEEYGPNRVTPEQFQQIARTYSDIRLGRSDIQLDTSGMSDEDAAKYRAETMRDMGNLLQTESGRELVNSLAYQPDDHKTSIHLRTDPTTGKRDPRNAEGGAAADAPNGSWADGKGGNAQVTYVPGDDGGIQQPTMGDSWLPMRSDVTLFHEMVHAHHAAYGSLDQSKVNATDAVATDEAGQVNGMEYQAVGFGDWAGDLLTENTYRAERAEIGANDVGERTTGGVSDDDMPDRTTYFWHQR